ncbi:MAG: hypothetical protein U0974_01870 [Gemmatimonadales bacterium]|nr:hypothetical protein [Gemmatimonadales bacterium]
MQLYLCTGAIEVRLRRKGNDPVMLCLKSGHGLVRAEHEEVLTATYGTEMFDALEASGSVPVIEKNRFRYPGSPWEIDCYTGAAHDGLVMAEIELVAVDAEIPAVPPGLELGEEVTGQRAWSNQALALQGQGHATSRPNPAAATRGDAPAKRPLR